MTPSSLAQPQPAAQPHPQQPRSRTPSVPVDPAHPFAGVTAGDYVRDGVALLFLLVSLALRWDFGTDASDRIDVVLLTILSMFSLAVPAMARLGALGQGWTRRRIRLVRLLANVPYLVLVVVYLVLDLLRGGELGREGGVGVALGVGLRGRRRRRPVRADLPGTVTVTVTGTG